MSADDSCAPTAAIDGSCWVTERLLNDRLPICCTAEVSMVAGMVQSFSHVTDCARFRWVKVRQTFARLGGEIIVPSWACMGILEWRV